jgi:fructose-bisphosphate aldolase class II
MTKLKPGVVYGKDLVMLLNHAKENGYAIPAVNCTSSSVINSCLMAAKQANSPIIIQFSNGGGAFIAGKKLDNTNQRAAIAGSIAGALHVRQLAELYGVPVIIHTDHCAKKLLPWVDGLISASEEEFKKSGKPLFSSHMLDLSEEPLHENIEICVQYLKRMSAIDCFLEIELGITGGEEDGVDNTDADSSLLYSQPHEIYDFWKALQNVAPNFFSVAAAFGNVHGVYKPGNVKLRPDILANAQKFISEKEGLPEGSKPVFFVFHGGSGSDQKDIRDAISYGVIKMNIDTDTQWSYWEGVKKYVEKYGAYLQGQIGNPEGDDKPNKKYYDPRAWIMESEKYTCNRLLQAYEDLQALNVCAK